MIILTSEFIFKIYKIYKSEGILVNTMKIKIMINILKIRYI